MFMWRADNRRGKLRQARACVVAFSSQEMAGAEGEVSVKFKCMMAVGLLAGATMALPGPTWAQSTMGSSPETGSLITRRAAQIRGTTKTDARLATREYGSCLLKRFPKYGDRVALEPVHTDEYFKLIDRMVISDCLSHGEIRFPLNIVRSAVIEALYIDQYGRKGPTEFSQVPPIDYLAGYPAELPGNARNIVALAKFGDCVSRNDPVNARALAVSIPGSSDETQRLAVLGPSFNGCVVQGEKLTFSRSVIRGAVSEGLFRLSRAVSQAQAGAD
jgi:hypothetical protein